MYFFSFFATNSTSIKTCYLVWILVDHICRLFSVIIIAPANVGVPTPTSTATNSSSQQLGWTLWSELSNFVQNVFCLFSYKETDLQFSLKMRVVWGLQITKNILCKILRGHRERLIFFGRYHTKNHSAGWMGSLST